MKPNVLETSLMVEHQIKALLVKLTWVMFSGMCLVFISSMRWDDGVRAAYFFGKLGVGLALLAGVGLLAAGVVCLDDSPTTLRVRKALWGFALFWLAIVIVSWFLTKN